ncbi:MULTISPECIES: helix-turn-helix transcriptional regulator [unclassified Streptomyces]|uniref:response regulator transcription factor n=1 Tax=unclassified Streptomyces TaxID=2593676 RepID=UPI002E153140|nr:MULTISPECIES: helix-turn-helix transcriptional regulator [unclassified Streptomyces]WSR29172.1 helix-turn-helix transcriptional regulator [Streptomyces sp. NBC_01205]
MADIADAPPSFTPREQQVLVLLSEGETYCRIASRLGISRHTVDTYLRHLRRKTGTTNRTQLAVLASQLGFRS